MSTAVHAGEMAQAVADYLCEKVPGVKFDPGMYTAFAILSDDKEFIGGVIVSNWRGTDCEISCASETPMAFKENVMATVFSYVFSQLGCVRCTSITTKRNTRARKFLEGLGFVLEGNLRLGYDGAKDALIYGLLASECRYLAAGGTNGQEIDASGTDAA